MNSGIARKPGWKKQRKLISISKKNARLLKTFAGIVSIIFGALASSYPGRAHWYDVGVDEIFVSVQLCAVIFSTILTVFLLKDERRAFNKKETYLTLYSLGFLIYNIVTESSYLFVFCLLVMLIIFAILKNLNQRTQINNS